MNKTKISIIIPTYNRAEKLKRCLKSILSLRYRSDWYEIIIVDDASTDRTKGVIKEFSDWYKNISLISNKKNRGPASSRNKGVKNSKGEIIVFIDDDCIPQKGWFKEIEKSHKRYKHELAIGGKTESLDKTKNISIFRDFQRKYCMKRNSIHKKHLYYLPTDNISYKREVFKKVGYFNESLRYSEDIEFNMRLSKINKPVKYNKDMIVYHEHEKTIRDFIKRSYQYGRYIPLIKKEHPELRLIAPLDLLSSIKFIFAIPTSIILKIFNVSGYHKKIILTGYIILDEIFYRWGGFKGLKKTKNN